jgi:DNA-binding response OmpR family regulator
VQLPILLSNVPLGESATQGRIEDSNSVARLLIVDDLKDSADSLATLMSIHGMVVEVAYDGEDAIHKAKEFRPDVMLIDIGLPRKNGYEVAREVRALPEGKNMLLVAVTGWGQQEDVRKAAEAGFDQHTVKPAGSAKIIEFISNHMQTRR